MLFSEHILSSEWHPTKNDISFSFLTLGSNKKVWWLGKCGHEWEAVIALRVKGTGCPYCSSRKLLVGFNDLATINPLLASEWHPKLNGDVSPTTVMSNHNSNVWWLGECGHEWEARVSNRNKLGRGCPYCAGQKTLPGFNDLLSISPVIAAEWHPTKNNNLNNNQFSFGSKRKVWWLGECGHEWEASIQSRVRKNYGCPVCSNRQVLAGFNDLATIYPQLSSEWHPKLNGDLSPEQVTAGSDLSAWWLCSKGHEWQAVVYSRRHNGCLLCSVTNFVSQAEKEIFDFIIENGLEAEQSNRTILKGSELDIYVPNQNIAVEFNGLYWHSEDAGKGKYYHYDKWKACKDKGIQLVQVWEDDWKHNPELIKRMLSHKMKFSQEKTIYARKTAIREISLTESRAFLKNYHIQGSVDGSVLLGLYDKNTNVLVAVMVLKKESNKNNVYQILRYATSCPVVGGFTKLLKHVEKTLVLDKIFTFSDNCVSDGGLYENNGFKAVKELPPDYMYIDNRERKHKFGYRLKRFRNDPNLIFQDNLNEKELAKLNKLPRIWDAGKTKWEINYTNL